MRRLYSCNERRFLLATACVATVLLAARYSAAESMPYEARVVVARAQVRSGPGERFYPTDTLARGETVEVYREQSGGWLAIRPPAESFSWVSGRQLKLRGEGLAEVDQEEVASRIGSRFGGQRNAVQVQLKKGEIVEIVGEESVGGETWYKIAPPAGEFRWIYATSVERVALLAGGASDSAAEPIFVVTPETDNSAATATETTETETSPVESAAPTVGAPEPGNEAWRAAPNIANSSPLRPAPLPDTKSTGVGAASAPVAAALPSPAGETPDALARELTDIELRLSRMVAQPPAAWQIEPLRDEADELRSRATSQAERETVSTMIAKLDHFAAIGRRYRHVGASQAPIGQPPIMPLAAAPGGAPDETGLYDAVGILRPVVSRRPGAPQFALVDERGQVISFVSPTPDVNLQPYVGRRVGVSGSRGFIPEFHRPHVTAGRVAPLSERLVR